MAKDNKQRCKEYKQKVKKAVITMFGGKCVRCGFDDDRALQLDHVDQSEEGYNENFRGGASLYVAIYLSKRSKEGLQLLCANCNWIKRSEESEHAHSKYSVRMVSPMQ